MKKLSRAEKSWIFYDWANSVYATIIMAAIFPIYFSTVAKSAGFSGDIFWGYTTSAATFIVAICAPILGAIGDYKGMKKRLFTGFLFTGVIFTLIMAITDKPVLMLIGYGISYIGFAGGNLFYDSFLTDVAEKENMDKVSSYGYAMGYVGGSTIAFAISIVLIMFGENFGIDGTMAVKLSVVLTSIWWAGFSIPMLKNVKQVHYVDVPPSRLAAHAVENLKITAKSIVQNKKMLFFIVAYFFYIDGVGTVIHMATAYGSTLGLGSTGMILALMVTQLVAVPCSILFSKLSGKFGTIRMLSTGIVIYMCVCLLGFYMGFSLEPHQFKYEDGFVQVMEDNRAELSSSAFDRLKNDGLSVLALSERTEEFSEIADKAKADFPAEADKIESLEAAVTAYISDDTKSADFEAALAFSSMLFWVLAVLVGTSQGGMQALSRSYFGKIIPAERSNEYFGFFDIFGKFAAVVGPALYAGFAHLTGRSSIGILSLVVLFAIGGGVLFAGRKHLKSAE
ncbi:MAG: MFS transporter [Oscillospiraceae bacterium]|jgi:UMF1 family MFS transporter